MAAFPVILNALLHLKDTVLPAASLPYAAPNDVFRKVYEAGERISYVSVDLPAVGIMLGRDTAREAETSEKLSHFIPFSLVVYWQDGLDTTALRAQIKLLAAINDAVHSARDLGGYAIDTRYTGDATHLQIVNEGDDETVEAFKFSASFETHVRHVTDSANTQV